MVAQEEASQIVDLVSCSNLQREMGFFLFHSHTILTRNVSFNRSLKEVHLTLRGIRNLYIKNVFLSVLPGEKRLHKGTEWFFIKANFIKKVPVQESTVGSLTVRQKV